MLNVEDDDNDLNKGNIELKVNLIKAKANSIWRDFAQTLGFDSIVSEQRGHYTILTHQQVLQNPPLLNSDTPGVVFPIINSYNNQREMAFNYIDQVCSQSMLCLSRGFCHFTGFVFVFSAI